jgi:hypothetical protein
VAWAMLPLLAVAWLNGAAACVGMSAGDGFARTERGFDAGEPVREHVDAAHGHHADAAHGHRGSVADEHSHHVPSSAPHDHADCPHCPPSGMGAELGLDHAVCGVAGGAATTQPAAKAEAKPLLTPMAWVAPVGATAPTCTRAAAAPPLAAIYPRALNLRYCVFLL